MTSSTLSLYVHIPFCRKLCTYCAFNTYAGFDDLIPAYVAALIREADRSAARMSNLPQAHTLYFGGGTPSVMAAPQVEELIDNYRTLFNLTADAEITLEANPGDLIHEKLRAHKSAGINRLSIGVQSAHASELKLFGRRHSFTEAAAAFERARQVGFDNISVDLIYGVPGQTLADWQASLDAVIEWEPEHISLYSLGLETGTSLYRRVENGNLPQPDTDLAADMYDAARERLQAAGYIQYEISNWARPGYECVHNKQYWFNESFLGFGAGAHGAFELIRYWNVRPIQTYIDRIEQNSAIHPLLTSAVEDYEESDLALQMAETAILQLRLVQDGIDRRRFEQRFGVPVESVFQPVLEEMHNAGLIEMTDDALKLTERAYLISNQVFMRLLPEQA